MKGIFLILLFFPIVTFSDVLNFIDNPSAYGVMMGGALYTIYGGPQSIAYNPAGISEGQGAFFFSHMEHYLGLIRDDFLSGTVNFGNLYIGGAFQTMRAIDTNYMQYELSGSMAYNMHALSLGGNINAYGGTDILNGFSADLGGIFKLQNYRFALTLKNVLSKITWVSSTVEYYPTEIVLGIGYENSTFDFSAFGNITSQEYGLGVRWLLTRYFSVCGGYETTFGVQNSKAFSVGTIISNYLGFDLFISYTFLNSLNFGQTLNPFTVSMNYKFGG